ncbi:MAG: putative toxin-antitoxin system toxin component, PIN family [Bryobacteraceae bacterium]
MRRVVVVDTTVWISALIFGGVPLRSLRHAVAFYTIAISREIYNEIADVFCRPKFVGKVNTAFVVEELDLFLNKAKAEWFSLRGNITDCLDPRDDKFLDCALVAGANVILSSDRHLRRMDPYHGIRILNP